MRQARSFSLVSSGSLDSGWIVGAHPERHSGPEVKSAVSGAANWRVARVVMSPAMPHNASGLAADASLANRVRSGTKQP